MTTLYYVRHAEPNYRNHDDPTRELSAKGLADRARVTQLFAGRPVDAVCASPYRRAADTVQPLARQRGLVLELLDDLRERRIADGWIRDFDSYSRRQWADFDYKLPGGESLREVEVRQLRALRTLLARYPGQSVVVGSHGTALCVLIHALNPAFGYGGFERMRKKMPWAVRFLFAAETCREIRAYDLFEQTETLLLPQSTN